MKRIIILLASVPLLLNGCSKREDVTPVPGKQIFKLIVDPNFSTSNSADWLIIHDIKGNLLFSKLFESSDTVFFNSNNKIEEEKINITILKYATPPHPGVSYNLVSYLQIPFGEVWTLKNSEVNTSSYFDLGSFNVVATNIPLNTTFTFSDKTGYGNEFTYIQTFPYAYESKNYRLYPSPTFLLTTRDAQDNLRYKFLDSVKVDDQDTVSYLDMSIPESITVVSFPVADWIVLSVEGFEQNQPITDVGYRIHNFNEYQSQRTKINIGYPNRFNYYHTNFYIDIGKGRYMYDKSGAKSDGITLPVDATFSLTNPSIENFSFTSNKTITRRVSSWSYDSSSGVSAPSDFEVGITWIVNSPPDGEQKVGPLPASFNSIYPELKTEKLTHYNTTFFLSGAVSYSDLIDGKFKGKALPAEHEIYSVIVFQ